MNELNECCTKLDLNYYRGWTMFLNVWKTFFSIPSFCKLEIFYTILQKAKFGYSVHSYVKYRHIKITNLGIWV